jgi:hypothetical protein
LRPATSIATGDRHHRGSPDEDNVGSGHLSYCAGGSDVPLKCDDIPQYPSSALAVGDINGDHYGDVVQGDDSVDDGVGEVRVWLGRESGLSGRPKKITQDTGRPPGDAGPVPSSGTTCRSAR